MSESVSAPNCSAVADEASFGKARAQMVGIRNCLILFAMAGVTVRGSSGKTPPHMAACARNGGVSSDQFESCAVVIEYGSLPLGSAVAGLALGGEAGCQVIWIRGCIVVFLVTTRASGIQTGILSIGVAGGTA